MILNNKVGLAGKVLVCKKFNEVDVPQLPEFNNLILDSFINAIYAGSGSSGFGLLSANNQGVGVGARAGTGATPPAVSDTGLVNPQMVSNGGVATITGVSISYDAVNDEYVFTRTARTEFAPRASSITITELAFYTNLSATPNTTQPIVSRTLIKDSGGNPSSITLLTGEILVLLYTLEVRMKARLAYSASIKGVDTLIEFFLHHPAFFNSFPFNYDDSKLLGAAVGGTNGLVRSTDFTFPIPFSAKTTTGWTLSQPATEARTPLNTAAGLKSRIRFPLAGYNGTVKGICTSGNNASCYFMRFTPAFTKTNQDIIDLEFNTVFTRL